MLAVVVVARANIKIVILEEFVTRLMNHGMGRFLRLGALVWLALTVVACGDSNPCSTPAENCEGSCVDLRYDPANCGACGTTCGANESCDQGACVSICGPGTTDCTGSCVDTDVDPNNCGGCGVACGAGEVCNSGACAFVCPPGFVDCNGTCIDPMTDGMFCGATGDCQGANAGVTCGAGEVCDGAGACQLSCQSGLIDCNGTCIDPTTDEAYCGATGDCQGANAGAVCGSGEYCDGTGACQLTCQPGLIDCNGTCVDPNTDEAYCGASGDCQGANAGAACASGEVCDGSGSCQLTCQSGLIDCNGTCIDPNTDEAYCGATGDCQGANAGATCGAGEICDGAGSCQLTCQSGLIDCNGTCVDPNNDEAYCGASGDCQGANAGVTCGVGEVCDGAGVCQSFCQSGLVDCNGTCVDPDYDPNFCGARADCQGANAGVVCAAGEYCSVGTCVPAGVLEALMPPQTSTFGPNVRGYFFTAPSNFVITGLRVPNDIAGNQSIELLRLNSPPPQYPMFGTDFTSLAYIQQDPTTDYVPVNAVINAGDIIGILGQRGTTTSYAPSPNTTVISGQTVTISRLIYQAPINNSPTVDISDETGGNIGRIEFQYIPLP